MSNIEKINTDLTRFIEFIHNKNEIKPLLEDIYLITVHVAGLYYIDNIDELFPQLEKGKQLKLFREKNNKFDKNAILVKFNGEKIGYVPKKYNVILANLMDGGKELYGLIENASEEEVYKGDEFKLVKFKIFLKE